MDNKTIESKSKVRVWRIAVVPVAMFGFAFSMVPLYKTFCDLTGFNGNSIGLREANGLTSSEKVDEKRRLGVSFITQVAAGMPIIFRAEKNTLEVTPGKLRTINFTVENRSDKRIIGQAIPSVSPAQASVHFRKLECFCFQKQEFAPGEKVTMPLRFTIAPAVDESVKDVSLAYTFYYLSTVEDDTGKASIIRTHNQDFSEVKEKS